MIEKHYTPDQLSQLEARRRDLGEEGMQRAHIERSLHSMYEQEGVQAASRGALDEELMAYVGRAMEARPGRA